MLVWDLGLVEQEVDDEWSDDLIGEQKAELETVLQAHYRVFQERQSLPHLVIWSTVFYSKKG